MTSSNNDARRKENVLAVTLAVLLGAVLLTSHAVSGAMARYTTSGASTDSARVALFGHDETINLDNWAASMKPGQEDKTLKLHIANYKNADSPASEVAQSYDIEVVTAGNLPLTYSLKSSSDQGKTWHDMGSFDEKTTASKVFSANADDAMTFQPGIYGQMEYELTVTWPAEQNKPEYANIPDFLQVNINVKQID